MKNRLYGSQVVRSNKMSLSMSYNMKTKQYKAKQHNNKKLHNRTLRQHNIWVATVTYLVLKLKSYQELLAEFSAMFLI